MRRIFAKAGVALAVCSAMAASSATAGTVDFSFIDGSTIIIHGQFTFTPGLGGIDTVTGVTGTYEEFGSSAPIAGSLAVGALGGGAPDNLLYTLDNAPPGSSGLVDGLGIGLFTNSTKSLPALSLDIANNGSGGYVLIAITPDGGEDFFPGAFSVSAPEPAAWMLMLCGLAGLGAALRSRRWDVGRALNGF